MFECDAGKDEANRFKHGLRLMFGRRIFDDLDHLILAAHRPVDGEDRYKVIGLVDGKLFTAVHVLRGDNVRFISVRRSNAGEQRSYHSHSR